MKKYSIGTMVARIFLILYSIIVIIPFAMLFLTSTKSNAEFYKNIWAFSGDPVGNTIANYSKAYTDGNIGSSFLNTVFICGAAVVLTLALSAMVSYAITRRRLKRAESLSFLYLIGLLIPGLVGLTPMFLLARLLNLLDTRFILILSYGTGTIPFCVFVMTAFFRTIPQDLEDSASIDGANPWQTFGIIILPLVKPALITAGIFCFLDYWSDYMRGLLFIISPEKSTISMRMLKFRVVSGFKIDWGVTMAASVLFILPVLIIYAIFQRQLISGLTAGSVKG